MRTSQARGHSRRRAATQTSTLSEMAQCPSAQRLSLGDACGWRNGVAFFNRCRKRSLCVLSVVSIRARRATEPLARIAIAPGRCETRSDARSWRLPTSLHLPTVLCSRCAGWRPRRPDLRREGPTTGSNGVPTPRPLPSTGIRRVVRCKKAHGGKVHWRRSRWSRATVARNRRRAAKHPGYKSRTRPFLARNSRAKPRRIVRLHRK
jgi:hypothetical protein